MAMVATYDIKPARRHTGRKTRLLKPLAHRAERRRAHQVYGYVSGPLACAMELAQVAYIRRNRPALTGLDID